jgi:hypothetical protein
LAVASVFLVLRKLLISSSPVTPGADGGEYGMTPIILSAAGPASFRKSSSAHQFRQTIWAVEFWDLRFWANLAAGEATFWMMTYFADFAWPIWATKSVAVAGMA